MNNKPITINNSSLDRYQPRANTYRSASKANNTLIAYASDWTMFTGWCHINRVQPLPASVETVTAYITHLADNGFTYATIQRRLVAISRRHQSAGLDNPTKAVSVKETLAGIARIIGTAPHDLDIISVKSYRRRI